MSPSLGPGWTFAIAQSRNVAGVMLWDFQGYVIKKQYGFHLFYFFVCFFFTFRTFLLEIHPPSCEDAQATWRNHMEVFWP